ncbi:coiled-coil domain-containing protein 185 [Rhynchocyon petersi]
MVALGRFSPRPSPDFGDLLASGQERASSARLGGSRLRSEPARSARARVAAAESEASLPWQALPLRYSPTPRPGRRGYTNLPWESRSLTDVTQRLQDRTTKQPPFSRPLDNAWGEAGTLPPGDGGTSLNWRPLRGHQRPICQHYPPAQGDLSLTSPLEICSSMSEASRAEKMQDGRHWAVPVRRGEGCASLSSVPTEKTSVPSKVSTQSPCVHPQSTDRDEWMASLGSQSSQPEGSSDKVSCEEIQSQHSQLLKNKLTELVISSRDQKIVALVLARLQKAQRMRELQHQAAVAWEELKRSDQKVQMTLEKERRLLLQQSQEQWLQEKELPKNNLSLEQQVRKDRQVKRSQESPCKKQLEGLENRRQEKLERASDLAQCGKQCQLRQLKEQQRLCEQTCLQLQKRLERASRRPHLSTTEDLKTTQETNLTSVVNHQARKVLMDCQAKAEELLRKLSLEQSFPQPHETEQCLLKEHHQLWMEKEEEDKQQVKSEEQRKIHKRMLMELADQKVHQTRTTAHRNIKDRAKHMQDLSVLRQKNHILKLKVGKEDKCHIEDTKEAIKKKQQRIEQVSREKVAALEGFQKISKAPLQMRDKVRAHHNSVFDQMVWQAQPSGSQHRGSY